MKINKFLSLLFSGPKSFGQFFIGSHVKPDPIPPGFVTFIDDDGNTFIDDDGNQFIAPA